MRNKISHIFLLFCILLFVFNTSTKSYAQTGNYVSNGSFEDFYSCFNPNHIGLAKGWRNIDSSIFGGALFYSSCYPNVPFGPLSWQWPKTGNCFALFGAYCQPTLCVKENSRSYLRNRLKKSLQNGKIYCVKFYVSISNNSSYGIDAFGIYFGDNSMDTITHTTTQLTYFSPQINNTINNIITDTLNWVEVTGTFTATGNESNLLIGNFKSDANTNKIIISTDNFPYVYTNALIDDVSCIELNLPAYAGPNKSISLGDSTYIGRESDFAIDPGCMWYKLPNTTTAIDTSSGIWVKPTSTSTYVVKQTLDCSPEKWDTVVVFMNLVGFSDLNKLKQNIELFPNPADDYIELRVSNPKNLNQFKSLKVCNSLGMIMKEEEIYFTDGKLRINIQALKNGMYFIRLEGDGNGIITKRFSISR